jgi:hypothetical protein
MPWLNRQHQRVCLVVCLGVKDLETIGEALLDGLDG